MKRLVTFLLAFAIFAITSCTTENIGLKSFFKSFFGSDSNSETSTYEIDSEKIDKQKENKIIDEMLSEKEGNNIFEDYKTTFANIKASVVEERAHFEAFSDANKIFDIDVNSFYGNAGKTTKKYNQYSFIENMDTVVVVKGNVVGNADNFVKISQKRTYEDNFIRNVKINKKNDNRFYRSIKLTKSGFYDLEHQGKIYQIFITPGDTLNLTIDHSTNEGLIFNGENAASNNYLRCKHLQEKSMADQERNLYNLTFEKFKEQLTYLKNVRDCNFNDLLNGKERISKDFIAAEEANINYEWARDIIGYKNKAGRFDKDKALKKIIKKINKYKKHNFNNKEYKAFAEQYFEYQSQRNLELQYGKEGMYKYNNVDRAIMKFKDIDKMFDDKLTQDFLKTKITVETVNLLKNYRVNPIVKLFRKNVSNYAYNTEVDNTYYKHVVIDDGAFAPNFSIKDKNGKTFTKNNLLGKYTYIAVWATWCAPCRIEQPHLQKLRDEYANVKNLQILSVSIDKDKSKWTRALNKDNLQGKQFIAPGNWDSKFVEAFNLRSVPKYILINPDGEIIDLSTSKPSTDVRRRLLDLGISL